MVFNARCRLAALWLSQTARVLADNALRMFVVLEIASPKAPDSAWHLVNVFYYLPFILVAPINGAIGNELPKRWVVVGSSAYCLMMTAVWMFANELIADDWTLCIGLSLVMAGSAVFSPVRYALLPAAAHDTHLPLLRVNALIEMGASMTAVAGLILTMTLYIPGWRVGRGFGIPDILFIVNGICVFFAFHVWFASDVRRPELFGQAVEGFFLDCLRIWRISDGRTSVLFLAGFWG